MLFMRSMMGMSRVTAYRVGFNTKGGPRQFTDGRNTEPFILESVRCVSSRAEALAAMNGWLLVPLLCVAEARRLCAEAQRARQTALRAQARALRLTEVADHANQAAAEAQMEAARFLRTNAANKQGQKMRAKLFADREVRESLTAPPGQRFAPQFRVL